MQKIEAPGPKRILALDGGGIRGALTIGYLEKIEKILRSRYQKPQLVLSDYYDLIGGTSTGAILATLLALGKPVKEIKKLYLELGGKIFGKRRKKWVRGKLRYFLAAEYDVSVLESELDRILGNTTLGSKNIKTGLAIFAKRADTYSVWTFHNNTRFRYYEDLSGLYLRDLVRASSAAPTFFLPKEIMISGQSHVFIDGGVSNVNNPGLMLFLMATLSGYGYTWPTGKNHLLLTSIGTGYHRPTIQKGDKEKLVRRRSVSWAKDIPDLFMIDANENNQLLLESISTSLNPQYINAAVGNLSGELITQQPLLSYCRYNTLLEKTYLAGLDLHYPENKIVSLRKLDHGYNAAELYRIGRRDAKRQVKSRHLPSDFDFGISSDNTKLLSKEKTEHLFKTILQQKGIRYCKYKTIEAQQVTEARKIETIVSSGKETSNTAQPGDYLVRNETSSRELYIVKKQNFEARYHKIKDLSGAWTLYQSVGSVIAIEVTEKLLTQLILPSHFYITPDWDTPQYVSKGDYIVMPPDESEIYRIARKEFEETYNIVMH